MRKKRISAIIVAIMCIMLLPVSAYANGISGTTICAANGNHSMAIKADGSLWAWGLTTWNQLGAHLQSEDIHFTEKAEAYVLTPVKVMDDVVAVSLGSSHSLAIKKDGALWGWGNLGLNDTEKKSKPIFIMDNVIAVSANGTCTYVIKADNSLWAWGADAWSGLGDGTKDAHDTPTKIMENVSAVSAGNSYVMVIKTDGSLWAWGINFQGNLGDGTKEHRLSPVKVMDDVTSVSAGVYHTVAVKSDGTLWAWGDNKIGQLGDGTAQERLSPVKVMDGVITATAGYFHTLVIKSDHSLWTWGGRETDNYTGDNIPGVHLTPVKLMENVAAVSSHSHTMVLKTDGSLWAWGTNRVGELGDGTNTDRSTPVRVMDGVMLPTGTSTMPSIPAVETPSSWATEQVNAAITAGLVPEALQSKYTAATTRAEFCALAVALYETATGEEITERMTFNDTSDLNVQKMGALGVVAGIGNGNFAPDQKLTREQAATMLARLADAIGKPLTLSAVTFADNANISSWAIESVGQIQSAGIMGGVGNNTFAPKSDYTREQSIITIMRLFDIVK